MIPCSDPNYSKRVRKAILTLGRQPDSNIFVLSPTIRGPFEESTYVCVDSIAKKEGVVASGATFLRSLPECEEPLDSLLVGLQELTQDRNVGASLARFASLKAIGCYVQQIHACKHAGH